MSDQTKLSNLVMSANMYLCPACKMPLCGTPEGHLPDCIVRKTTEHNLLSDGWKSPYEPEAAPLSGEGGERKSAEGCNEATEKNINKTGGNAMSKVWEHTLDEYEQAIKRSDTHGAAILRALLLPQLERPSVTVPKVDSVGTNCGLCGQPIPQGEEMFKYHGYSGPCPKVEHCECPEPMLSKSNKCDFCGKEVKGQCLS